MRKSKQNMLLLVFLLIGTALVFSNCGSGGGGTTLAELTEANAPEVAGSLEQVMSLVEPTSSLAELEVAATSSRPPLTGLMDTMKALANSQLPSSKLSAQGSMPAEPIPCDSGSGSMSATWDGPDIITDISDISGFEVTMTFDECTMDGTTLDGSATIGLEDLLSDSGTISFETSYLNLQDSSSPDGTTDMTMSDFSMELTATSTSGTVTMSGSVSGTAEGTPVDGEFDDLTMAMEMVTGGEEYSISGRMKSTCIGGWIEFSTPTPVFVATDADCPSDGEVDAVSGENTVSVVVGPSSSEITVYFNDAEVTSYPDCDSVEGLCT